MSNTKQKNRVNAINIFLKQMLTIFFVLQFPVLGFSQPFSKTSFQIGEYKNAKQAYNFLKRNRIPSRSGLSIALEYKHDENKLYLAPFTNGITFEDFAKELKIHLEKDPDLIFPLFIKHSGPENWVIQALNRSGLRNKAFHLPSGERWPSLQEIIGSGRRLIIFSYFNNNSGNKAYQYSWDHIAEFPFTSFLLPVFEGYYSNGAIENELMMFKDFMHLNENLDGLPPSWDYLNLNTFLLDHTLKCWKLTGKRPNFIFYSSPKTEEKIGWLLPMLNNYTNISGSVTYDGKPLKQVFWTHENEFVTNGNFNFPITEGYELELTPTALGYDFSPSSFTITDEMSDPGNIQFIATPLSIDTDLTGYFDFNGKIKNDVKPNDKFKPNGSKFVNDMIRGDVLKIENNAYITLNPATEFGIVNNSFTMSIWFKLIDAYEKTDFCILGTSNNEYRKGLHINIRRSVPYFGFYNNDVTSFQKIEEMKWYHMAIRYNIEKGEQSIFINGQKTGSSNNHPSFLGESELLLGHGISMNNFLNGYIDDLAIWQRALSDDEIQKLTTTEIQVKHKINHTYLIFLIIIGIILIVLLSVTIYMKTSNRNINLLRIADDTPVLNTAKNSILLFGDFTIIDKSGGEITPTLSPKLKEVFILIFLNTLKQGKGISTKKLTETIWPGFTTLKAANNRGVTLNKLKKILSEVEGLEVVYEDGFWKTSYSEKLVCDYTTTLETIRILDTKTPLNYPKLFNIVSRGSFLENMEWPWLDEFRSSFIFEITDALLVYCRLLSNAKEYDQLYKVTNRILKIDDLNEQATKYQLNYLCYKGHHNKSKHKFQQFCERYKHVYGQAYQFNFQEFLKTKTDDFS